MKKACLITILACFSMMFTGCGSSSSDDNNGTLPTTDIVVDSTCENDTTQCPQPVACPAEVNGQSIFDTNAESTCYPTGNDGQYVDSDVQFSRGACNCDSGFMPVRKQGGGFDCVRTESIVVTGFVATMTFSSGKVVRNKNGVKKRNSFSEQFFDLIVNQQGQTIEQIRPGVGNCYNDIPQSCDLNYPYQSCASVSQPGYQTVCVPSNGGHGARGICVNQ